MLTALVAISLTLTVFGFILRRASFTWVASAFWMAFMAYCYKNATVLNFTDQYYLAFLCGIPLVLVCWFEPVIMRGSTKKEYQLGDVQSRDERTDEYRWPHVSDGLEGGDDLYDERLDHEPSTRSERSARARAKGTRVARKAPEKDWYEE